MAAGAGRDMKFRQSEWKLTKTTLIGAAGQLGRDLQAVLSGPLMLLDLPEFDITDAAQVEAALEEQRPDVVINTAAQTNVDGCESAAREAFAVNALGALHVARAAVGIGAYLIYVSTDYVFGAAGMRASAYVESDQPGPVSVYGASKLAGEQLTSAYQPDSLVLRTSGLYGHAGARGKGGNFVETMLRLGGQGQALRVVDDQVVSPTSTVGCAAKIAALMELRPQGIVHVAAADSCSWHEFAREIFAQQQMAVDLTPIPTSEYPTPARRPAFSSLRSERLAELGVAPCRGWREMLHEYLDARS